MSSVTVSIDPHVHSDDSYDGHEPVDLILEHAAEIGLDAVVITDHDVIGESKRAADIADEYGLIGIPGVEVSTAHGHLLAIGVERMPPRRRPYDETVAWIRDHGGVAIVPHPFQRSRHGVRERNIPLPDSDEGEVESSADDGGTDANRDVAEVDAIEVFNAWLFTGYRNRRARRFAAEHGYPGIAASDAHHLKYVGRAFTEVEIGGRESVDAVTADDVLDAIRNGTTRVDGRRAPVPMAAKHYVGAAGRKSGYYARTSATRSATAASRGVTEVVSTVRVAVSQGAHRAARVLSWVT
ncbi:CehA/McbA family metallohydrolase [Halorubrum sp. N11]|uniref:CehA/McbA family metallohydrolase n=1 Tax=Halorubrum sp. N11 TaxID=3402276 RepID=UPI003EBEC3D5